MPRPPKPVSPFRCVNSSPEVIRPLVMMYVRLPFGLRDIEGLFFERGIAAVWAVNHGLVAQT